MTKTYTPEQFAATSKAGVEALQSATTHAFTSMEKLVELNLAASKAMMSESFASMKAVLGAKDPQEAMALQAAMFQPMAEKSVAYGRHVITIASESGAEFTKALEAKVAEGQAGFTTMVENIAKNAPAGSEASVAFFKNTMTASQNAIESAKASAKSAADAMQANMTAVSERAIKATAGAYKKA
jgi:phasin family protein